MTLKETTMWRTKTLKATLTTLALCLAASVGFAQQSASQTPPTISYFHLEFVVKIVDSGKVTSSRTYAMDANTDPRFHASYRSDTSEGASPHSSRNRTDIDCNDVHLVGTDSISFSVSAMITSNSEPGPPAEPISATYNGSFYTLAAFGKPTIVFLADAQAPNRKIQMEVTATPIHLNLAAKP